VRRVEVGQVHLRRTQVEVSLFGDQTTVLGG
jgi:hypothetical protein